MRLTRRHSSLILPFAAALAEFVGTFMLAFVTIAAAKTGMLLLYTDGETKLSLMFFLYTALVYGMSYAAIVYALSFDGAGGKPNVRQLNPAVSIALVLMSRIRFLDFVVFVLAQAAGGWVGYVITPMALPHERPGSSTKSLVYTLSDASLTNQLLASSFVSFVFILVVLLTFFDKARVSIRQDDQSISAVALEHKEQKPQTQHEINCLIVLSVAVACAAVVHPFTFDFCNPIMAMGFSYLYGKWGIAANVGPYIGAVVAMLFGRLCDWQLVWVKDLYGSASRAAAAGAARRRGRGAGAGAGAEESSVQLAEHDV